MFSSDHVYVYNCILLRKSVKCDFVLYFKLSEYEKDLGFEVDE